MKQATRNELRCECRRQPLLATYGLDERGRVYLHVKVFKARRIFGEILVTKGEVQLRCRECFRWYTVTLPVGGKPKLIETPEPELPDEDNDTGMVDSVHTQPLR
jgi:hypothetical protein